MARTESACVLDRCTADIARDLWGQEGEVYLVTGHIDRPSPSLVPKLQPEARRLLHSNTMEAPVYPGNPGLLYVTKVSHSRFDRNPPANTRSRSAQKVGRDSSGEYDLLTRAGVFRP